MTTTNLDTGISDVDNNAKRRRTIAYMTYMHQTITGKACLVLLYFGTAHMVLGAGFMQLSFFCPSVPSSRHMLLLQVCCCRPSSQVILIDCCMADRWVVSSSHATAWHTAANVGSARLSSPGVSWLRKLNPDLLFKYFPVTTCILVLCVNIDCWFYCLPSASNGLCNQFFHLYTCLRTDRLSNYYARNSVPIFTIFPYFACGSKTWLVWCLLFVRQTRSCLPTFQVCKFWIWRCFVQAVYWSELISIVVSMSCVQWTHGTPSLKSLPSTSSTCLNTCWHPALISLTSLLLSSQVLCR